jgi:hypothetical protein
MWFIVLSFALGSAPPFAYALDPTTGQIASYSTRAACQAAITKWEFLSSAANPDGTIRTAACRTNQSRPNPCPPNGPVCTCCFLPPFPKQRQ